MIHAKTSYFPAWNKRFYFLYFIDSSDSFHPFRRNFDRSFIFTTDNIPLLFQVQLGSRCHQAESAYPTIKVTQVFPSSPCLGILFSQPGTVIVIRVKEARFSSPCLGILFSRFQLIPKYSRIYLFSSPCLGILFSPEEEQETLMAYLEEFSSPCLGILFSLWSMRMFYKLSKMGKFSSPCLGILFSPSRLQLNTQLDSCFRPHVWGFFFHKIPKK